MVDVSKTVKVERVSGEGIPSFFGYYDISPESPYGDKVLYNIPPFTDRMPEMGDELIVGFTVDNVQFNEIGRTAAWNYQEGCRLQWLDNERIIYNIIEDGKIKSAIYDIEDKRVDKKYEYPVYSVDRKNLKAISYNLYRSRYSYPHTRDKEETDYDSDGIFLLDLESGKADLIISLKSLSDQKVAKNTWVEHAVFNPSGDKFFFFHRGEIETGGFFTRFCVSDLEGNIKVLLDSGMCSHSGWMDDNKVTSWARIPSRINSLQKSGFLQKSGLWKIAAGIYHAVVKKPEMRQKITNEAYVVFDTESLENYKIENKEFVRDGHETWSHDGRYMLTDTYPDEDSCRHLMLYDYREDIVYYLGKFHSYPEIGTEAYENIPGIRCDLHPKWSFGEKYVYFDSTHEGYRGLYRIDISGITK